MPNLAATGGAESLPLQAAAHERADRSARSTKASSVSTAGALPALRARELVKRYGAVTAVAGVSFEIPPGQLTVVVGPNGAGKTTLLEMCEGLRKPDAGSVELFGLPPDNNAAKMRMGVQLDNASFNPHAKVKEIIALFTSLYGRRQPSPGVISGLGLAEQWSKGFGTLSKGWKQRVAIAVALLHEPELIFLDEVCSGLDPEAKHAVWDLINAQRARGAAVVMTTHSVEEAERLAERVLIIAGGRVLRDASPEALLKAAPARSRVEVRRIVEAEVPGVAERAYRNGNTIFYTDEPGTVTRWLEEAGFGSLTSSGAVGLEDLYLYYIARSRNDDSPAAR